MSEPENFLSRWSRMKREADATPEADKLVSAEAPEVKPPVGQTAAAPVEEPAFDLSQLPSLNEIAADTDMSMFMKPGVPAALRHAALRRAWTSDPAIRDFRGLQENDWDFNAPDGVPGFGTFKSDEEIKALAQRLFGPDSAEEQPLPQPPPHDTAGAPSPKVSVQRDESLDKGHSTYALVEESRPQNKNTTAVQQDEDAATQRVTARRHGGALPQ